MMVCRLVGIITALILISACSGVSRPAPVVDAGTYTPSNRGSLQSNQYRVNPGETLFSIAWRAGVDPKQLATYNQIPSPYIIYPGQVIKLKPDPVKRSTSRNPKKTILSIVKKSQSNKVSDTSNVVKRDENVKNQTNTLATKSTNAYSRPSKTPQPNLDEGPISIWKWPTSGKIIKRFSSSDTGNKGIDIKGERGQKVFAAASGRVVYAGSALRGYGQLIIIRHNDDYLSAYAHNSRLRVKEQQTITVGQHIADMGDTGTTDTRLHFEIRYRGKSVDPLRFLPKP
jgi:lipoprotein NlpD